MAPVFSPLRKKRIGLTLAALAGLVALFLLLRSQGEEAQSVIAAAPQIIVTHAVKRELVDKIIVAGTLVARDEVRVTAQVDGLAIIQLTAEEGDKVEQGAVLAKLDDIALRSQLAQNAANLARAEAASVEARKALARTTKLRSSGAASQEQLDQRISAAKISIAEEEAIKAQRNELSTRLARTQVRAPVAGIIAKRNATLSAIANAQEPLFILISKGLVELKAEIADAQHNAIHGGEPATVTIPGRAEEIRGKVRLVSPQIDPQTRLGEIRISLDTKEALPVGGYARAVIETAHRTALAVPLSALAYDTEHITVQQVIKNTVVTQDVVPGIIAEGYAEIKSGLIEGDSVVAKAGTFVRNGDRITPVKAQE